MSDGIDRGVNAAPLGETLGGLARVVFGQVHRDRPKRSRQLEPLWHGVDRKHRRRSGRDRHLCRAQPDRPEPEHRQAVAGLDLALRHRVIAGAHHVAGEQRDVVADAIRDRAQRHVGVRDQRPFGLCALE